MATHALPIELGLPDTTGNVYWEPAAINLQVNDRFPQEVLVFRDSGTRIKCGGTFRVPKNYIGTAKVGVLWSDTLTTGDVRIEYDYKAIADGESSDPSTDDESVGLTVATPATARLYKYTEIALTSANFVIDDFVQSSLVRDGADVADTLAGSWYVAAAWFIYNDV